MLKKRLLHPLTVLGLLVGGIAGILDTPRWQGLTALTLLSCLLFVLSPKPLPVWGVTRQVAWLSLTWGLILWINHPSGLNSMGQTIWRYDLIIVWAMALLRYASLWEVIGAFTALLQRIWRPRPWIGQMGLLLLLSIRFIPLLLQDARRMRQDAALRLKVTGQKSRLKDVVRFFFPLVMKSVLQSESLAESVWVRGWRETAVQQMRPFGLLQWSILGIGIGLVWGLGVGLS